jgi:1,2-diacylglycerol 3-alpha-glucosyltransferase
MKICLVIDCYGIPKNGTTSSARRFASELRKMGNEVRIIGVDAKAPDEKIEDEDFFPVRRFKFPVFQPLIEKDGFCFADGDYQTMTEVIKWADVVHLYLPFPFEIRARRIAEALNKPITAAFHLQPDSVTYGIHLSHWKFLNWALYKGFYRYMYRYVSHIHCPSQMIADVLRRKHYDNCTHIEVISNGVIDYFHPIETVKPAEFQNRFIVLTVGRIAGEKKQDIIIKAIGLSKYNSRIQLIISGEGPNEKKIRKLASKKLINQPLIRFNDKEHLREIINYSDLYVHASEAEIEGIACTEAFSCGLVPVISDSKLSATNGFALDSRCLFRCNDPRDLAAKIDYFIEHPEEKSDLSKKYVEFAKKFTLSEEVAKFNGFLEDAVREHQEGRDAYQTHRFSKEKRKVRRVEKSIRKFI